MGFDNECIVNIQSLAGEYFCPVCRTLVYPHEALQSQCTHLYCKPCLTYVVGTTKACPYDGYLVTEADSKPLTESNKALAEVIGKIPVHCLFHRSGCSWQGPLSECTSHCSGCTFGNSPVVCNRCGIQIVHRQVQEHAQTCPGANPQAQQNAESAKDTAAPGTVATANSSQTNPQPAQASQAQLSQTTTAPPPAQGSNQANANPQVQPIASAAGIAAEQWYPQQFQQYYQQYPGYDPYQQSYQQYYPYQQQTTQHVQQQAPHVPQPQIYAQHQTAMQPHPQPVAQVQGQTQAHPQPQMQPQPQQQQASQHQLQTAPQVQPQAHSFVAHNQVNPQQASHPAIQPHPQLQSHNQPAAQVQNPQQQAYPQSQPHLFPHSMQPPVQQNFQAPQYQQTQSQGHQPHLQIQPQPHSHPQPPLQSHAQAQTQNHPHLHPLQPNSSQSQQPATHVVPGHQSHPPVQPQQQMLPAPPQQHPMHMHPSSGSLPPAAQFPQQSPHMRPPQGNASMPNQPQPNLMQTQGQLQGVPPAQHQQIPPQTQQGHLGYQRPVVQPMQQPIQQYGQQPYPLQASGPFQGPSPQQHPFTQQPMHTHSRPQGPTQSFQHSAVAFPTPPPHSGVQAPGVPPHQSQTYAGRPTAPNHAAPPQPFPQSGSAFGVAAQTRSMQSGSVQPFGSQNFEGGISNQQQMPFGQQFSESAQEVKHTSGEKNAAGQDVGSASKRTAGKDVSSSATGGDSVGVKALEFQAGEKSGDEEHRITYEGENKGTHSGVLDKGADAKANAEKIGSSETSTKKTLNDEDANGSLDPSPAGNEAETRIGGEKDGIVGTPKQVEYSSVSDSSGRTNENKSSQGQVPPQGSAVGEFGAFQDKGVINSSYPVPHTDQEKHQLAGPYGSSSRQQRPDVLSNLQSGPFPGAPPNVVLPGQGPGQLRPQGPGHVAPPPQSLYPSEHFQQSTYSNDIPFGAPAAPGFATSFSQGAQSGQQYQNNPPHSQPVFSRTSNAEPIGGPLHGPDGGAVFQNQRVNPFEGRYPDHHVSGPFDRGQYGQPPANEGRAPGFDTASGLQAKNGNDDHRNPFLVGPAGRFDQGEHQEAPRQYPKPSLMGVEPSLKFGNGFSSRAGDYPSHDFNHDPSRFLPPYHPSGGFRPNDIGERPTGFHEDPRARGDPARTQPEFLNSGAGFGMNRMPPRSPGREYIGIPSRGIGGPQGPPEGSRSFDISSDSVGKPFPEHFRNGDMVGQDFIPNHVRRGELFGPRNVQSHMRGVDGFGTFSDPHMGDFTGPGGFPNPESFLGNKSNHPRLGEPGFRSSYSLHGFPSDGGFYAGNLDPFDTFRKRMPTSMGWCRICKVDCDTVEGLDLHSQTTEHQQRTMDMVVSIKQKNAKRQKASKDHSSIEEGSRTRNAGNRGRGKKV